MYYYSFFFLSFYQCLLFFFFFFNDTATTEIYTLSLHDALPIYIKGKKSHSIVEQGLTVLRNLTHRGAVGWDPKLSDGAGLLIQIPDRFLREEMARLGVRLPPAGQYGVGMVFLPRDPASRIACEYEIERAIKEEGQVLLGWRDVPVDNSALPGPARRIEPVIRQVFIEIGRASCRESV